MSQRQAARRVLPRSPFQPKAAKEVEQWEVDDRVCHDSRGLGRVIRVDAETIVVDFGSGAVCGVAITSPKLSKLQP